MILEIQHETRLSYPSPVTEAFTELRMEPISDAHQSCRSFHLHVTPAVEIHRYQNGIGNRIHHISIRPQHQEVVILSASVVETHPREVSLNSTPGTYPLNEDELPLEALPFLGFQGPVRQTDLLTPILKEIKPTSGMNLGDFVHLVSTYIKNKFQYASQVTAASSPIDDVLTYGKGVCQDFAHLMIAILRTYRIPTRYISGYIHRPGKESQSHAWVECWLPSLGWIGVDPTNDSIINEMFVKVAIGRNFTDVPPNKGIYRGSSSQKIDVRVETRQLDRIPPMAWHEALPALKTPLRTISSRESIYTTPNVLEMEQQQQQQQQSRFTLQQQQEQQQQQ